MVDSRDPSQSLPVTILVPPRQLASSGNVLRWLCFDYLPLAAALARLRPPPGGSSLDLLVISLFLSPIASNNGCYSVCIPPSDGSVNDACHAVNDSTVTRNPGRARTDAVVVVTGRGSRCGQPLRSPLTLRPSHERHIQRRQPETLPSPLTSGIKVLAAHYPFSPAVGTPPEVTTPATATPGCYGNKKKKDTSSLVTAIEEAYAKQEVYATQGEEDPSVNQEGRGG